jgi:hypothetical protein
MSIDPSALSNKRAYSPSASSSSSETSPARKRPRVSESATSEEKKEARAARNRIAAQESRDRRKREFGELHERVAMLEAENAALREGCSSGSGPSLSTASVNGNERTERLERENAELLERVARLETVLTNVLPLIQGGASRNNTTSLPSPAPSTSSFQTSPSSPLVNSTLPATVSSETTRHLARVATVTVPSPSLDVKEVTPQQRVISESTMQSRQSCSQVSPSSTPSLPSLNSTPTTTASISPSTTPTITSTLRLISPRLTSHHSIPHRHHLRISTRRRIHPRCPSTAHSGCPSTTKARCRPPFLIIRR